MKYALVLIALTVSSIICYGQKNNLLYGTWIKTNIETADKNTTEETIERNKKFLKYTFEKKAFFVSTNYHEKGFKNLYNLVGDLINRPGFQFKIEHLDNSELVLVELTNSKITPNSHRIYFKKEKIIQDALELEKEAFFVKNSDTIYFECPKVYPKFRNTSFVDLSDFLQPKVEGLSNKKEHFLHVKFIINTAGEITDINFHHRINKAYDKAMKKALLKTKRMWEVPEIKNKKVNVLKSLSIHYIEYPKQINVFEDLAPSPKTHKISEEYCSTFEKAGKLFHLGLYNEAIAKYDTCKSLKAIDYSNVTYQKIKCFEKLNDTLNIDLLLPKIKKSKLKYVLK